MAYEIIINKRFTNKLLHVLNFLQKEWGNRVANEFQDKVFVHIYMLQLNPFIGAPTGIASVMYSSLSITDCIIGYKAISS